MRYATLLSALLLLLFGSGLQAAGPKFDNPAKAAKEDPDFLMQGEYLGKINAKEGEETLGVQVIALGEGKFQAVAYKGGLPGAGWDGKELIRAEGTRDGATVNFKGDKGTGTLTDGKLKITSADGDELGTLQRTERVSPTMGMKPPQGATVLFDGSDASLWKGGQVSPEGLLMQGTTSEPKFQSQRLHIEFRLPYQPQDRGQGRGNSGLYLQGRYEVQMLDSFGLAGKNNECGGIYSIKDPDVNMCLPPLAWQTYDVDFTAGKYDADGKQTSPPTMTVRHNGVVVHKDVELPKSTTAAPVKPGPEPGPVYLQNHGSPVRYRNIWVVEKK